MKTTKTYTPTISAVRKIIAIVMQETCTADECEPELLVNRVAVIQRVREEGIEAFGPVKPDGLEERLVKLEKTTAFLNRWITTL